MYCSFQLNKSEEAIEDCTKALELDSTYLKAYIKRAKWLVHTTIPFPVIFFFFAIYKVASNLHML